MDIFKLTLSQMLLMFLFIVVGFMLRKGKILPEDSDSCMSRLETYLFLPALNLYNMMTNCTVKSFAENSILILYGAVIVVLSLLLAYPLSKLFMPDKAHAYQRNVYKYAMTFGNYGFMGNFIALGIWGSEGLFKYTMFTLPVTLLCCGWGMYILISKDSGKSMFKNLTSGLTKPPMIALLLGVILGFLDVKQYLPNFLLNMLSNASSCMGPVAMVLAGFVIGSYDFRGMLFNKKVYIATALRLLVLPAVLMILLHLLGTDKEIMTWALIAFATPFGLNTIVYPAAFGGETQTGAAMAMISHTLSLATIPLMYLFFIVLL